MANSYIDYTTAGTGTNGLGQSTFSFSTLDYLNIVDMKVAGWNGSAWIKEGDSNLGLDTSYGTGGRDSATKTIKILGTPAASNYTKLRVYRSTTANALVDFVDGARLTESDLDTAYRQGLFVAQEVAENASGDGASGVAGLTENNMAESFYKEGTFTVTATPTGSGTVTLDTGFDTLSYTKIGNRVFISGTLKVASVSSPDGALNITTLPYTSSDITDKAGASISILNAQNPSGSNIDDFTGWIGEGSTTLSIYYVETSDAANSTGNSSANKMQANTQLHINLNYITSA